MTDKVSVIKVYSLLKYVIFNKNLYFLTSQKKLYILTLVPLKPLVHVFYLR